jgi:hypothetical protein
VLHAVNSLVIVGEETMDVTKFSIRLGLCILQLVGNHQSFLKAHLQTNVREIRIAIEDIWRHTGSKCRNIGRKTLQKETDMKQTVTKKEDRQESRKKLIQEERQGF